MRLGVFGGTFDPVHYGHLLLAECCREQSGLDQVWWVPAAVPPHKQGRTTTEASRRIEMLELALAGQDDMRVSTLEVERGGVSYTVDTLTQLGQRHPSAELLLLLGADSLADLPNWRAPAAICQQAIPIVVDRPGTLAPDFELLAPFTSPERLALFRRQPLVKMPQMGLSSSDIRRRAASGRSLRFRTPRAVEQYILTQQLYRVSGDTSET